jgi:thiol:disulfide interchange protein DsbD
MIRVWLSILLLMSAPAFAINEDDLLPVDEAFAIQAMALDGESVSVTWTIAEGYYMYRGRISFTSKTPNIELAEPVLPAGKRYEDEFFGEVQTYRQRVVVTVPLVRTDPSVTRLELEARSQGCADLGVCYPPHRQTVIIDLPEMPISADEAGGLGGLLGGATNNGLELGPAAGLTMDDQPLPEDQAFVFESIALAGDQLLTRFTIADGYYLYRDQIAFEVTPDQAVRLGEPELPPGANKFDAHFGDVKILRGQVEVPLPIDRLGAEATQIRLTAHYRGCKDESICYPPIVRSVSVDLPDWSGALGSASQATRSGATGVIESPPEAGLTASAPAISSTATEASGTTPAEDQLIPEQDRLARALGEDQLWTLLSFFGFGLLLAFTPCVFPMVPILSGIIAGQGDRITTRRAFLLSLVYVLAMALTYTVAGVIAGMFGKNLQAAFQNAWVLGSFSVVFVLLALSMFGFYELQIPARLQNKLNQISHRQESGTWLGVAIMGILSALIVGPCVAPPLAAALIYIGQSGDALLGGLALFALSLGMGTPLLVVGTSAGRYLPRAGAWMTAVKAAFGVGLLALALWMLERIVDPTLIMLGWGALAIASGVYMGALDRLDASVSGWRRLWKSVGVMLLVLGIMQFIGAAAGGKDWLQPLKFSGGVGNASGQIAQPVEFRKIKSLGQLNGLLADEPRPAMLDFYADWCVDCKRMEKYSFPEPPVQAAMADGLILKADVTANDDVDQALMSSFRIIGPPAILFFGRSGQEMPEFRVIGYQRPEAFAGHVERAFKEGQNR